MKLTKADRTRIAVSREKRGDGRTILYSNPNEANSSKKTQNGMTAQKIRDRVNSANRLYGVFFKLQVRKDLENTFKKLVQMGKNAASVEKFHEAILRDDQFRRSEEKRKKNYISSEQRCSFMDMFHYAGERLDSSWFQRDYRRAAAKIMVCISSEDKMMEEMEKLFTENNGETIEIFLSACKDCANRPFISKCTAELENTFTSLMKKMVTFCPYDFYVENDETKIERGIVKEINYLLQAKDITRGSRDKRQVIELSSVCFPDAEEIRMRAMLVRMRKTLKRGKNADIAIQLLQGLAQYEGDSFHKAVERLIRNDRENLISFIDAVNRDYYRVNLEKSIRNINVKVQPDAKLHNVLGLSNSTHPQKKALNQTLIRYAASPEESDQVLMEIKGLLFDYFLPGDDRGKEEYTTKKKLWNIPNRTDIYFDYDEEYDAESDDIETLCEKIRIPQKRLKEKIRYVNYGKYLRLTQNETDERKKYWLFHVKEFVEKTYVDTPKELTYKHCFATEMMMACWKEIIRFLCGKYIDIGKAVYHFTNVGELPKPENNVLYGQVKERYRKGISSFDYEGIKAEETLKRDIANAVVAAEAAFSRSVLDEKKIIEENKENQEDIFFLKEEEIRNVLKTDAAKQILRYFGGASTIEQAEYLMTDELVTEVLEQLKSIRNENFHYTSGKKSELSHEYSDKLWNHDMQAYQQLVRQRYYANNAGMFYPQEEICHLVEKLYAQSKTAGAQIPAFKTVLKKNTQSLSEFMTQWKIPKPSAENENGAGDFEGTLYFLLKEIYYRDFIVSDCTADYFFQAVEDNKNNYYEKVKRNKDDGNLLNAAKSFSEYVSLLKKKYKGGEISFEMICQYIMTEYNQQNTGKQEKEIYKHFKILLTVCMRNAFGRYLTENPDYKFLFQPKTQNLQGQPEYLDEVEIPCRIQKKNYNWYVLAHFLHPRQLNFLIGDFKSYIQYRQDILRRIRYAGERENGEEAVVNQNVKTAKEILKVLEFVRGVAGRVSNELTDYYQDAEEYAGYLAQYINFDAQPGNSDFEKLKNFCRNTVEGRIVDLYADAENPRILRNVELARMYAGGDVKLPGRKRITADDVKKYYKNKDDVASIVAGGLCKTEEELNRVKSFQNNKNRLTLTDVTDTFSMINDLLGRLISLSYLRERDEMYLLLGFYYMALQNEKNENAWPGEIMDSLHVNKFQVQGGLVLYQVASIFDFGTKLLRCNSEGKWKELSGQISTKLTKFVSNHEESWAKAIRLFENEEYDRDIVNLRNYVDHMKYYANQEYSILDLYSEFHAKFFGYSSKLQKSVVYQLQMVLEKYFIDGNGVKFENRRINLEDKKFKSMQFTYKLAAEKGKAERNKKVDARSQKYINEVKSALEYKRDR